MHEIDLTGAIAAFRHCRKPVVTVSVDSVRFHHPVKVGEVMLLEAVITRAFRTSMEVQVEVRSENPLTGEQKSTCSAYLTFVAIDSEGRPSLVPPLIPETPEDERRFEAALKRRKYRLAQGSED
jgi:acyl-CoA hydrolase